MEITQEMILLAEEISLDINDFLCALVGMPNDSISRRSIEVVLTDYLKNINDIFSYQVICNSLNNSQEHIDKGCLNVSIVYVTHSQNNVKFSASFQMSPGLDYAYPDIITDFKYTIYNTPFKNCRILPNDELSSKNSTKYEEIPDMPEALVNALRV
jgi:hypothetical protein